MTDVLSHTEMSVLSAVHRHRGEGYGVTIRDTLIADFETKISLAAMYSALERLEKRGFVEARFGEKTEERGGRRKKHFKVTGDGVQAMSMTFERYDRMKAMTHLTSFAGELA